MSSGRLQLLSPEDVPQGPAWLTPVLHDFRRNLLDVRFPCNFGRNALRHDSMYLTWTSADEFGPLAIDAADFVDTAAADPESRTSLAVFVRPPANPDEAAFDAAFWSILQHLHDHDDRPWPAGLPTDPDQPGWEFCYHGMSLFVFSLVPTNTRRLSRNLCASLTLLFQPRSVFTGIEVGTQAGDLARQGIRRRLAAWDRVGPHPSMGHFGERSEDEWRQYFLGDDNGDRHQRCPLHVGPDHQEQVRPG